jgi:gamma-glutamyl-gamma-aminobutyrate hydrolase PuuD
MKKIGIVGWNTSDTTFGITKAYAEWLSQFGVVQILSPQLGIDETIDLLILPGGLDLAPQCIEDDTLPSFYTSNTDVMKQYFYDVNLSQYINKNIPIFGICLGMQQLSVHFGNSLKQHHAFEVSLPRTKLIDTLVYTEHMQDEFKPTIVSHAGKQIETVHKVNSIHHQGVFEIKEGYGKALAISKEYKNVEIAQFSTIIYGVQYHPRFWGSY